MFFKITFKTVAYGQFSAFFFENYIRHVHVAYFEIF